MGCWEETCGLTNTPIFHESPVVMVRFRQSVLAPEWKTHRREPFGGYFDWQHIISIHEGTYDHYGWIKEIEASRGLCEADFLEKSGEDNNNDLHDYSFDLINDPRRHEIIVFFHRGVWDVCQDHDRNREVPMSVAKIPKIDEFVKVATVASHCRMDIFAGVLFQGHQDRPSNAEWARRVYVLKEKYLSSYEFEGEDTDVADEE
jgi:hypothetical protein